MKIELRVLFNKLVKKEKEDHFNDLFSFQQQQQQQKDLYKKTPIAFQHNTHILIIILFKATTTTTKMRMRPNDRRLPPLNGLLV